MITSRRPFENCVYAGQSVQWPKAGKRNGSCGYVKIEIQQPGTRLLLLLLSGYVKCLSSGLNGEIVDMWGAVPRSASI